MVAFIDDHKAEYGVEPICRVLPIAPSTYYWHKAREADPSLRSARAQRDELLRPLVRRVWDQNFQVYGAEQVWTQLNREGIRVARCTVARLMTELGPRGVVRGRSFKVTTHAADGTERPLDLVDRDFTASRPNELWVSDLTYVRTGRTFAYVAFIIDAFARRIVGWQISSSLRSDLALDALEQAISERLGDEGERPVHHSNRGDSYDNALAETIIGLYKTELVYHHGPWSRLEDIELATLEWVWWFNNHRLLKPIGLVPPAEFEEVYYRELHTPAKLETLKSIGLR